jgi:plastocyanin
VRAARLLLAPLVLVALLAAGCGGPSSSGPPTTIGPDGVEVANFSFMPSTLTVKAGTTVTWYFNQPSAPHDVVSLATPPVFNSGNPQGTGTYRFTFSTPGTYPYLCQVHPIMRGTIIVTP